MKDQNWKSYEWKRIYVRLPWLLLIPLGLLVPRLCAGQAAQIEKYFSDNLYKWIMGILSSITSLVPFSIAEWLAYILFFIICLSLSKEIIRVIFGRAHITELVRRVLSLVIVFGALLNFFYLTWGLNYFREPLKDRMALDVRERSVEELEELTIKLAICANTLRKKLPEDEHGVSMLLTGYREIFDALPDAYETLAKQHTVFSGKVTRAKAICWSKGLSWCGIAGIYIGLSAEPNVNVDAPAFLLPHAAAHELAHQLGIASENEAEFVGYLACLSSTNPSVQYSGVLAALIDCGNALHKQEPNRYWSIYELYGDGLLRDLRYQREYWSMFEGKTEETATQANDSYLKHNGQTSGVLSYGEAVDLLLAYYAQTDFLAK